VLNKIIPDLLFDLRSAGEAFSYSTPIGWSWWPHSFCRSSRCLLRCTRSSPCGGAPQQRGPLTPQTITRPNRLHTHTHPPKRLAHPRSPMPPLSTLTSRATHAHPTSLRSTGFCAIWGCISSSSSPSPAAPPAAVIAASALALPICQSFAADGVWRFCGLDLGFGPRRICETKQCEVARGGVRGAGQELKAGQKERQGESAAVGKLPRQDQAVQRCRGNSPEEWRQRGGS